MIDRIHPDRIHRPTHAPIFDNRYHAGQQLATKLSEFKDQGVLVLAIPNGGIPIAVPVALELRADLDFVIARKLPIPLMPEGGFGAVADDGTTIFNQEVLKRVNLNEHQINFQVQKVRADIQGRSLAYRANRPLAKVTGKTVILVDDGLASGYTMMAAVESVRRRQPKNIIVAVPAASATAVKNVEKLPVRVITVETAYLPKFYVSDFYRYWDELTDDDGLRYYKDWQCRYREIQSQTTTTPEARKFFGKLR